MAQKIAVMKTTSRLLIVGCLLALASTHCESERPNHRVSTLLPLDPDNWILNEAEEVPYAGVGEQAVVVPGLRLEQNAPNPFGPMTTVRYSVPRPQHVRLEVFNPSGQKVLTLLDETVAAGWRDVTWDGRDQRGRPVAPGAYFYRLQTEDGTRVRRLVRLR